MTIILRFIFILVIIGLGISCQEKSIPGRVLTFDRLKVKSTEIVRDIVVNGLLVGTSFERGEVYVVSISKAERCFLIHLIAIDTGLVKQELRLDAGDFHSPREYFSPSYMQAVENRYYIIDQFHKIAVFDDQTGFLYCSMFEQGRYFIDIYKDMNHKEELCFLLGSQQIGHTIESRVRLYRFAENRRPTLEKEIGHPFEFISIHNKNNQNTNLFVGYFWPASFGYEREQKVYYSAGNSRDIFIYDLGTGKEERVELGYLEAKHFSASDAARIGQYHSDGWEQDHFKEFGEKVVYEAYPGDVYHLGMVDIGAGKMGIIGDFSVEQMSYRLDVIDTRDWRYLESIYLPSGYSFRKSLSTWNRGFNMDYIDIEQGIHVYHDCPVKAGDFEHVTHIVRFKMKGME